MEGEEEEEKGKKSQARLVKRLRRTHTEGKREYGKVIFESGSVTVAAVASVTLAFRASDPPRYHH